MLGSAKGISNTHDHYVALADLQRVAASTALKAGRLSVLSVKLLAKCKTTSATRETSYHERGNPRSEV
jgi:hypothetical protein